MQRTFQLLLFLALVAATKATFVDRVVPEDQMPDVKDVVPTTTLLSVDEPEMQAELATLATHAHTGGQKTAIRQLTDTMTLLEVPKDGGTQALKDRVKAMMDVVKPAIDTMKAGLDGDFTTAQGDLSTLLGAINSTQRTVLDTEKADIMAASQKWCTAWEAKGVAVAQCTSATTNVTDFNPSITVGDALYKNIGSIECTAQVNGKCDAGVADLDGGTGQLKIGFQKARDDYYDLSTAQKNECDVKDDTTIHEATNKTAYDTEIKTTLDVHVAGCSPDRTVYDSAVLSFNTNNGHRAAMYEALDKIMYAVMLSANTTSIAAPKSTSYYTAKFPDYTAAAPTCPTRAQYATQISSYESLSLTETWLPDATTCADVAAATAAPAGWSSGYSAGGTMAHPSGPLELFGYGWCADNTGSETSGKQNLPAYLNHVTLASLESWIPGVDRGYVSPTGEVVWYNDPDDEKRGGPGYWQALPDTENTASKPNRYSSALPKTSFRSTSCDLTCRVEQSKQYCDEAIFTVKTCRTKTDGTLEDSACTVGAQVGCAGVTVSFGWSTDTKSAFGARFILPGGVEAIETYTDSNGNYAYPAVHHPPPHAPLVYGELTGTWFWHQHGQWEWFAKGNDPTPTSSWGRGKCTHLGNKGSSDGACPQQCYGRS